MLVSFLFLFFIHIKVRLIQSFNLSNFFISVLATTTVILIYTNFSALQESIIPDFFEANGQAQYNIKLFAWVAILFPAVIILSLKLFLCLTQWTK